MKIELGHTYFFRDKKLDCIASITVCDVMGSYFSFIYNDKMYNCEYRNAQGRLFESPADLLHHEEYIKKTEKHDPPRNEYQTIWKKDDTYPNDYHPKPHDDRIWINNGYDTAYESWSYYYDDDYDLE